MVLIHPSRTSLPTTVSIAMVTDDLFSVLTPHETIGFVHKVGSVFVSLRGSDFHHAVEVGQSLSWDRAVDIVKSA